MRTFPIVDPNGTLFAVEVEKLYARPKTLAKIICSVDGVSSMRVRPIFGASPEIHARFTYLGSGFVIWEPYGDNSRYWLGPADPEAQKVSILPIEERLRLYQPPKLVALWGNLISLRVRSLFGNS